MWVWSVQQRAIFCRVHAKPLVSKTHPNPRFVASHLMCFCHNCVRLHQLLDIHSYPHRLHLQSYHFLGWHCIVNIISFVSCVGSRFKWGSGKLVDGGSSKEWEACWEWNWWQNVPFSIASAFWQVPVKSIVKSKGGLVRLQFLDWPKWALLRSWSSATIASGQSSRRQLVHVLGSSFGSSGVSR